jgi:hypothetical protein
LKIIGKLENWEIGKCGNVKMKEFLDTKNISNILNNINISNN